MPTDIIFQYNIQSSSLIFHKYSQHITTGGLIIILPSELQVKTERLFECFLEDIKLPQHTSPQLLSRLSNEQDISDNCSVLANSWLPLSLTLNWPSADFSSRPGLVLPEEKKLLWRFD